MSKDVLIGQPSTVKYYDYDIERAVLTIVKDVKRKQLSKSNISYNKTEVWSE